MICGGHFLLPIHVSHSTASRGGTSEPQRVPVHSFSSYPLPCRAVEGGPFRARAALSPAPLRGFLARTSLAQVGTLSFSHPFFGVFAFFIYLLQHRRLSSQKILPKFFWASMRRRAPKSPRTRETKQTKRETRALKEEQMGCSKKDNQTLTVVAVSPFSTVCACLCVLGPGLCFCVNSDF